MIALTKMWLRMCTFNFLTVIFKIFRYWMSSHSRKLLLIFMYIFYDKIHADIMRLYLTNFDFL